MTGHGEKFGRKKEAAIAALLTHRNLEEAAKSIDVSSQSLVRWQRIPEFAAAYRQAKRDAFAQSVARLQQASSAAVTTLLKLTVDPNSPPTVRARAAYYILTLATKAFEVDDVERRIADLEYAQRASGGRDRRERLEEL